MRTRPLLTLSAHAQLVDLFISVAMDLESTNSDEELELLLLLAISRRRRRKRKRKRRLWIRPIFTKQKQQGEYLNLLHEIRLSDPESHFRYLRMSWERFDSVLEMVRVVMYV